RARRRGRGERHRRRLRGDPRALARADARAGRRGDAALAGRQRVPQHRQARPARGAPGLPAGRDAVAGPRAPGGHLVKTDSARVAADPARAAAPGPAARGAVDDRLAAIRAVAAAIPDPEIPVVTLDDLGILRDVVMEDGAPVVHLTPTYSGCPATEAIAAQVREALDEAGFPDARVRTVLSPAWTTDWIGDEGRRKLAAYGIAPPACAAGCGT